jgi:hypothetical protein
LCASVGLPACMPAWNGVKRAGVCESMRSKALLDINPVRKFSLKLSE